MPTGHAERLLPALRRVVLARETADRTDGQLLTAFLANQDADAFAVLVRRHGPMVLGVCRRIVGEFATAEDAFQAVFLVLARRAGSVRPRSNVGNWLYGVAYRTAIKARAVLARRRSREKQVETMPEPFARTSGGLPPPGSPADVWSDLKPIIDEELARLPERLRLPVVLCDLEGRPQRAVARELGVPPATLATRIAAARRLLAQRLTRRGVSLSGGALAGILTERASAAVVVPALAGGVVRAAESIAAGSTVSGFVSAHAVQLSEGVMRMMLLTKLKAAAAAALTVLVLCSGAGLGFVPTATADEPAPKVTRDAAKPPGDSRPPARPVDDPTYLNRLCLDLRGTPATVLEQKYFATDTDANKRRKVADWSLLDEAVRLFIAKTLGIPADRIQAITLAEGKVIVVEFATPARVNALAFSSDSNRLAVQLNTTIEATAFAELVVRVNETSSNTFLFSTFDTSNEGITGSVVLNERNFDVTTMAGVTLNRVWVYKAAADPPPAQGQPDREVFRFWLGVLQDGQPPNNPDKPIRVRLRLKDADTDDAFLGRVTQEARGTPPSEIERRYFAEDKDPKKREKLLDTLLKDPAVAKKLGDEWKKKMLQPPALTAVVEDTLLWEYVKPARPLGVKLWDPANPAVPNTLTAPAQPDRLDKLIGELLGAKKTDEQVLEAVTLAVVGRLPTAEEKRVTLAVMGTAQDRKAAWVGLAKAYAASDEAKKYGESLKPK